MDLEIEQMMIVSTAHLSGEDMTLLSNSDTNPYPYTVLPFEYGLIVSIPPDTALPREQSIDFITDKKADEGFKQFSKEFIKILQVALDKKIRWINFDRDGSEYEEFHKFNW